MSDAGLHLALPAAALLLSLGLLAHALRGRRVDDHPVCRRCGFDLVGRPADSARCSECGADLSEKRAVRDGRRVRRRALLAFALPAFLCSGGFLAFHGWQVARSVDWTPHKPVWWLLRDAARGDRSLCDRAVEELHRRLERGALSDGQLAAVVDQALAHQGDVAQPWLPAWGPAGGEGTRRRAAAGREVAAVRDAGRVL